MLKLLNIILLLCAAAGGVGMRMVLTKMVPERVRSRLDSSANLFKEAKFWLRKDLGYFVLGAAGVVALLPLIFLKMETAAFPVIGYLLGLVNWRSMIKLKGDLGTFMAIEIKGYRKAVAHALMRNNTDEAHERLGSALRGMAPHEKSIVYGEIVEIDLPQVSPYLVQAISLAPAPEVKEAAFHKLKEMDPDTFKEHLPKMANNAAPEIRQLAVGHLDQLDSKVAKRIIKKKREDEDFEVRTQAEAEWQQASSEKEINFLEELMTQPQGKPYMRPLRALKEELTSGSWQSILATRTAMGTVGEWLELKPLVILLQKSPDSPTLIPVIKTLRERDNREAALALVALLSQPDDAPDDHAVQMETILALGKMEALNSRMMGDALKANSTKEQTAMVRIIAERDEKTSMAFFNHLIKDRNPHIRKEAAKNIPLLPESRKQLEYLKTLHRDLNQEVRLEAYNALSKIGNMEILTELMEKYKRMGDVSGGFNQANPQYVEKKALGAAIRVLISKEPLYGASPSEVICTEHHTRAELHKEEDWQYPICRRCKKVDHLVTGVRSIRGVIGPTSEGFSEEGTYEVALWDAKTKKPVYADISVIEVRAGAEMDYDWAINAVLDELRNDERNQDQVLPVEIHGDPPLHPNSLRLLKEITGDQFPLVRT